MTTNREVGILITALLLLATPLFGQIRVLDQAEILPLLDQLQEVDFEDLPADRIDPSDLEQGLPNPLKWHGVTFIDRPALESGYPFMDAGHCSSPSCEPDPDNADNANIILFLNPGTTISFPGKNRIVVLDIQGIGDNPFTLVFTDKRGRQRKVTSQGTSFGVTLVGVLADAGIRKVTVESVGGSEGPVGLARLLFAKGRYDSNSRK